MLEVQLEQNQLSDHTLNLYETDFYAWTQKQAELIRLGQWQAIDIDNLVEEIESLGKQLYRHVSVRKAKAMQVAVMRNLYFEYCLLFIRTKKPLSVEMNHMVWLISYPNLCFPRNFG